MVDAGVVDQHVGQPVPLVDPPEELLHLAGHGHVGDQRGVGRRVGGLFDVDAEHPVPGAGEGGRDGTADPARAAGHDGDRS